MSFRGRGLSIEAELLVVVRIILESVLIAIEPIALLIDVGSCMANLPDILELLICQVLLDHLVHITLIFLELLLKIRV